MKFFTSTLISLFILIFISACGGGGNSSSSSTITSTSLSASSTTITVGNDVDLTATFIADGTGNIDNSVGTVTSGTPVSVSPSTTTTYTLTVTKSDGSFETSAVTVTVVALNSLSILNESFDQVFQTNQPDYTASVGFLAKSIRIKATSADAGATITVDGIATDTDGLSQLIELPEGVVTVVTIVVTQNTVSETYTITISRASATAFAEQAILAASNTEASDEFGYNVALSGDTLAVGAFHEDSSTQGVDTTPDEAASNSGAVYVFVRSAGSWMQQAYIKASNAEANDEFGISVSLSGDTLAVGATGEDSDATGIISGPNELASSAGAVYIFTRTGSSWSEQAYIKASNASGGDLFGTSVALSGETLAVGAHIEGSASGAAYVFTRNETTWSEQAYIKASNAEAGDRFGHSVTLSGDTLAVGAYNEDSGTTGVNTTPDESAFNSGAVYVYTRSDTVWTEQAYIKASNPGGGNSSPAAGDNFGYSVALSGDTLAVGAWLEDSSTTGINTAWDEAASASGAVYVFVRDNTTWNEQAYIKASNTGKSDLFGKSIALSGDILAVGAQQEDSDIPGIDQGSNDAAKNFGAVYVYSRSGTSWIEQSYIKASTTVSGVEFGHSVALAGDTIAVGVPLETTSAGAVYIFE